MEDYFVVHYDGNKNHITYTDTEEQARAYLAALITTNQVGKNDTLSIVRTCDDSIIYYKRRNNSLKTVLGKDSQASLKWREFWHVSFSGLLTKLYKKITNSGVMVGGR